MLVRLPIHPYIRTLRELRAIKSNTRERPGVDAPSVYQGPPSPTCPCRCGKSRLSRIPPHQSTLSSSHIYTCGDDSFIFPERMCNSPEDTESEWRVTPELESLTTWLEIGGKRVGPVAVAQVGGGATAAPSVPVSAAPVPQLQFRPGARAVVDTSVVLAQPT